MRYCVTPDSLRRCGIAILCLLLSACHTLTFTHADGEARFEAPWDANFAQSFWFWGLLGRHDIYLLDYCDGKLPAQYTSEFTSIDGLSTFATLGIYGRRSVKIWCTKPGEPADLPTPGGVQ